MKKTIYGIAILAMVASCMSSCASRSGRKAAAEAELSDSTKIALEMEQKRIEEPEFEMVTSHGTMKIKLYSKTPKHRENFTKLVAEKYYDGMRFHRVIEGFMIQGGDPYSRDTAQIDLWGQGGPGYTVPAEFVNEYWHKKGAIAREIWPTLRKHHQVHSSILFTTKTTASTSMDSTLSSAR